MTNDLRYVRYAWIFFVSLPKRQSECFRVNKKKNTQHRIFPSRKEKAIILNIFLAIRGLDQGGKEEDISWICDKDNAHV